MNLPLTCATLLLTAASAWAQPLPPAFYQPLGLIKAYLQLSDAQLETILNRNVEYSRWASEKHSRLGQVQVEIAGETAKDVLDPMALGLRYVEVETICREIKDRGSDTRTANVAVLNADQKAKLKALEDAIKLAPVIAEAQSGNLMGGSTYPAPFLVFGSSTTLLGGVVPAPGCSASIPLSRLIPIGEKPPDRANGNLPARAATAVN